MWNRGITPSITSNGLTKVGSASITRVVAMTAEVNPRISIIIPSRNDAAALGRTLDDLDGLAGINQAEVIVAAWGDYEGTERTVAGRARLLWPSDSTRAALMNAGARVARGD